MYGKKVRDLRISVIGRCNLNCFFCHREWNPSSDNCIGLNEVRKIVEVASGFGIESVKITGGEPLLRDDIVDIVMEVSHLVGEVSLVTNGVLLEKYASDLKGVGLSRVNVNLPSLKPSKYGRITGGGDLVKVLKGIESALEAGLNPVKINMVVLRGVNEDEVDDMLGYASSTGAVLQLVELQPLPDDEHVFEGFYVDLDGIEEYIASRSVKKFFNPTGQRAIYALSRNGKEVLVEIVAPTGNPDFCSHCSKLRVTCNGRLKPCLLRNDNLIDIAGPIRAGADMDALRKRFMEAIMLKEPYWKKGFNS